MKVLVVAEGASELNGALETLLRRLSANALDFEFTFDHVARSDIHAHHGKGQGYFKKAVRWLFEAEKRGFGALVLLIDQDDQTARLQQIADAQTRSLGVAKRALGVAIRKFDAWMLADERALTEILGIQVQRQPAPETIADPKAVFDKLIAQAPIPDRVPEIYARIAQRCDMNLLIQRCSKGFGTFAERVKAL